MAKHLVLAAMLFAMGCGDSVPQAKGAPKPEPAPNAKITDSNSDVPSPK